MVVTLPFLDCRYMSEGELLDNVTNAPTTTSDQHGSSTVISASHLTDVVSSPQRNYYMWKDHAGMQGKDLITKEN